MRPTSLASLGEMAPPPGARVSSTSHGEILRLRAMVEHLADELAAARWELEQIRAVHVDATGAMMTRWRLTRSEAAFLAVLVERGEISREGMDLALYGGDPRGDKVLDVWLCKCRRKVPGLEVVTVQGWGWRISEVSRARIRAELAERA